MSKGWNAWLALHEEAKQYKKIFKHWKNGHVAKVGKDSPMAASSFALLRMFDFLEMSVTEQQL